MRPHVLEGHFGVDEADQKLCWSFARPPYVLASEGVSIRGGIAIILAHMRAPGAEHRLLSGIDKYVS